MKLYEIIDLELDRVDSVEHPANVDSKVLLAKSADDELSDVVKTLSDAGIDKSLRETLRGAFERRVRREMAEKSIGIAKAMHNVGAQPQWARVYAASAVPEAWMAPVPAIVAIRCNYAADHPANAILDELSK